MFGISDTELFLILLFAFLVFGPDKLPGMGRTVGRALRQFRHAQEGFTSVVQTEVMDPLQDAMKEGDSKKASERKDALDDDADRDDAPASTTSRKTETFAERKARLEREKAARERDAQPKAAPAGEDGVEDSDAPKDVPAKGEAPKQDEPAGPDLSAAALYGLKPKRQPEPEPDADADSDADVDAPASAPAAAPDADVDSDSDVDVPTTKEA